MAPATSLRPLDPAQLARVAGGDQANLPIFSEIRVVGHTVAAEDGAAFFQGGFWYPEPYWR